MFLHRRWRWRRRFVPVVGLGQGRSLGDRPFLSDDQIAHDRIVETERTIQFLQGFSAALDIHEHVMGLVHFIDGIRQLSAAPVFEAMDGAVLALDHGAITLDHGRHLFALVRMDHEHNFVVSHCGSLRVG